MPGKRHSAQTAISSWSVSADLDHRKPMPDPLKLAKDIRDQLAQADFSIKTKSDVSRTMKDVELLVKCFKETGPYLRKPLVDFRHVVKDQSSNDEFVISQLKEFTLRLERVKAKKHQISELKNKKEEEENQNFTVFQCYIDDNIRIVVDDKVTDLTGKMNDAKKIKRILNEIERLLGASSFSKGVRMNVRCTLEAAHNLLALDGITSKKMKSELNSLKHAVQKGKTAEEEVEKKIRMMRFKIVKLTKDCENKRDEAEKSMRELSKIMLDMDRNINEINKNREKTRQLDMGMRRPSDFWVPPTLIEKPLDPAIINKISREDPALRVPIFTHEPITKGREEDFIWRNL